MNIYQNVLELKPNYRHHWCIVYMRAQGTSPDDEELINACDSLGGAVWFAFVPKNAVNAPINSGSGV